MSVAVLIPWRDAGCEYRVRALAYVLGRLAEHPWPVVIGHHDDGEWCKALAVADALSQTTADTLIIHDADVWTDGLARAVEAVRGGEAAWAVPHRANRGIYRLTEASTARHMAGEPLTGLPLAESRYDGVAGGGIAVVHRSTYEACPLDPRFRGWGGEDESWGYALRALYGAALRGRSLLVHLWHPPQPRISRATGSEASGVLRKRYARARFRPNQIAALVEEARCSPIC